MSKWHEAPLGELAETQLGKMLDKKKNQGEYYPYLGNDNVQWGYINHDEIKEMRFRNDELSKFLLKRGDLLVCEGGDPGRCALWDSDEPMYYQKALHRVRCGEDLDNKYLYYFLIHIGRTKEIRQYYTGGATIKHLPKAALNRVAVRYPDIDTQRRIAEVLFAYDELIENNRKQIGLLEEAAQRLYKEWFIDYKFPGYETALVDAETNLPGAWKIGVLGDLVHDVGRRIKKEERDAFAHYLPIDAIPAKSFSIWESSPVENAESSLIVFDSDDFVFGAMRPYFHKVICSAYPGITRTTCFVLREHDACNHAYAFLTLFYEKTIKYATTISVGTTMPYVRWSDFSEMPVILPPKELTSAFGRLANPLIEQVKLLSKQCAEALEARNRLLPKLMSGEIEVG